MGMPIFSPPSSALLKILEEINLFPPGLFKSAFHLLASTLLTVLHFGFLFMRPIMSTPPSRGRSVFGCPTHVSGRNRFKIDSCALLPTLGTVSGTGLPFSSLR